jgi:S-DNA-T family DNA segregation ATPase FtsK/SpoIIIE
MKVCPTCKETYKDDDINFCLADGSTLVKKKNGTKKQQAAPVHSRLNEVLSIAIMAVALLMLLALITSSPADPSMFTSAPAGQKAQNWIGPIGANFAALLFNLIGIAAYVFPLLLVLFAWRIFRGENLRPPTSRLIGFFLLLLSSAALLWMVGSQQGVINKFWYEILAGLLGKIGTGIFLLGSLVVSTILLTNLTFVGFFSHLSVAWGNLRIRIDDWRAKHGANPEQEAVRAKERSEKRREIRKGKTGDLPSLAGTGATVAVANVTVPEIIPSGALERPEATKGQEEDIPPTIAVPEPIPVGNGRRFAEPEAEESDVPLGSIPISPMKHTGDLDGDESGSTEIDEEIIDEPVAASSQNFDNYVLPGTHFLTPPAPPVEQKEAELRALAADLSEKTKEFNVTGRVVHISQGPVVTTFEFKPDPGVKYSRVTGLVDDLCLALKAESIRIDRIPGKAFVGIEVPNQQRENIYIREVIESRKFKESQGKLSIALGKTIDGLNYIADLAKMPHLLIAGATGAGKSVGVNSLVVSILYKARPDEVKFIMVDPKRLELGLYADIPHLATPIITDPKRAAVSLRWAVSEMERRYRDLAGHGVRNIDGFNAKVRQMEVDGQLDDNGEPHKTLPYIVIIIDELADLMMVSGKEVEEAITRLAQMARAVGIHLVLATQRPSVDVITGLIKANFPSRISFRVSSKVDSRTIIDSNGAENLLGKGDMLFLPPGNSQLVRVHGAYVDEKEIQKIVEFIKSQGKPEYDTTITKTEEELDDSGELPGRRDPLFTDALRTVVHAKRASTSLLQRHLRIGYGRAAAILDAMVKEGYIGEMDGSTRARPILQKAYEDLQDLEEMNAV